MPVLYVACLCPRAWFVACAQWVRQASRAWVGCETRGKWREGRKQIGSRCCLLHNGWMENVSGAERSEGYGTAGAVARDGVRLRGRTVTKPGDGRCTGSASWLVPSLCPFENSEPSCPLTNQGRPPTESTVAFLEGKSLGRSRSPTLALLASHKTEARSSRLSPRYGVLTR